MVLVILGGLLLGGLLTKLFGAGTVQAPTPAPSFTPLPEATATFTQAQTPPPATPPPATATPSSKPAKSTRPSPRTSASPAPTATASPRRRVRPRATAPLVIILTPTPFASVPPTFTPAPTATPRPPPVTVATAAPVLITGANSARHAAAIVNAYIAALARGDSATATDYLASGLPTESFINPNVSVTVNGLHASRNTDGSYNVSAEVVTSKGTYLATFTLKMGAYGMQITGHNAMHI